MPRLVSPGSLDEALAWLAAQPGLRPLAGGVGILRRSQLGGQLADTYLDLGPLASMSAIRATAGGVVVGALATLQEVADSNDVARAAPMLAVAAGACASPGIRSIATLGGNLIDEPGLSDPAAALLALGAEAILYPPVGGRQVGLESVIDKGLPSLAGLLLGAIVIENAAGRGWGFERLPVLGQADASGATVAAVLVAEAGSVVSARAWATAISQQPLRLSALEASLVGARLSELGARRLDGPLGDAAGEDLDRTELRDEPRASAWYRQTVVVELALRAVATASDTARTR